MFGLLDDAFSLPGRFVDAAVNLTAGTVAATLCLPLTVVEAAIEAGCKTEREIQAFADRIVS